MKKEKILYIITKSNWGGAQRYVFDLACTLPKEEYEVSVAAGGTGKKDAKAGDLKEKLQKENIDFIFLPYLTRDISFWREFAVFFKLIKLFKREKPDILHLNSSKIGGLGALAGRFAGVKKIIFTAHGFAYNENRPLYQILFIKFLSWLTILFSTSTIVLMEKDSESLKKWPLISKKIFVVRNGIQIGENLSKNDAQLEIDRISGVKISDNTFVIGSIGELHKNKGYEYAINSLAGTNLPLLYFIAGDGEERKNLENLIEKNNLQSKVILLGNVPSASRLIKAFEIFLIPSIKEGLPYVLLEAGLSGVPVIATKVGGIPEVIENGKDGILVNPRSPDEIAIAIQEIIGNPEKSQNMALNLAKKVSENFSLEKMIKKTLEIYGKK